ncbi:hypothetical protein BGZ82_001213 [Podila clonocystis]|nr:hypothetical protein BGZ82_001213 [Podila clonocystis]
MSLQQDALALLYTLTRISVSWLLSLLLCLVVCGRVSLDVIYLSQQSTAKNLTFDRTTNALRINSQIGSNKITANVTWEPVELNSIITNSGDPWDLTYSVSDTAYSSVEYNQTFVNKAGMLVSFRFIKDTVATFFTPSASVRNTTAFYPNVDFIPHPPTGITTPSSLTVWAALMDMNGTAILETGIVGFRSMRAGRIEFNCSVA